MKRPSPDLTERLRILVLFSVLLAKQDRRRAYDVLRESVRKGSLPPGLFSELLLHLSLFLGYPPYLEGLGVLSAVVRDRTTSKSLGGSRVKALRQGKKVFRTVYGSQANNVLQALDRLQPGLAGQILAEAYGRIMARKGIDQSEREIANVAVLFALDYKTQLYSHLRGALRAGIRRPALVEILKLAGSVSGRSPAKALRLLEHLEKRKAVASF